MEKYQTFWLRAGAALIDGLILFPVGLIGSAIAFIDPLNPSMAVLSTALTGFVSVFYYILMHARYGQTVGKMATGVKVVDETETPINFNQAVLRSLPQLIPVMFAASFGGERAEDGAAALLGGILSVLLPAFYVFDIIVCLVNEKRRALHDFIAKTVVVKIRP